MKLFNIVDIVKSWLLGRNKKSRHSILSFAYFASDNFKCHYFSQIIDIQLIKVRSSINYRTNINTLYSDIKHISILFNTILTI